MGIAKWSYWIMLQIPVAARISSLLQTVNRLSKGASQWLVINLPSPIRFAIIYELVCTWVKILWEEVKPRDIWHFLPFGWVIYFFQHNKSQKFLSIRRSIQTSFLTAARLFDGFKGIRMMFCTFYSAHTRNRTWINQIGKEGNKDLTRSITFTLLLYLLENNIHNWECQMHKHLGVFPHSRGCTLRASSLSQGGFSFTQEVGKRWLGRSDVGFWHPGSELSKEHIENGHIFYNFHGRKIKRTNFSSLRYDESVQHSEGYSRNGKIGDITPILVQILSNLDALMRREVMVRHRRLVHTVSAQ